MSELAAAVGLTSLDCMATIVAANRANHVAYCRVLAGIRGIRLISFDPNEASNYQYVVLEVDQRSAGLSRDELATVLAAENVLARRYFFPAVIAWMRTATGRRTRPAVTGDRIPG